ncbi:MAG TPA: hypothetical protein VGM93_04035 [Acidimicrobiales bacterium]|jgi:hypothetical protein
MARRVVWVVVAMAMVLAACTNKVQKSGERTTTTLDASVSGGGDDTTSTTKPPVTLPDGGLYLPGSGGCLPGERPGPNPEMSITYAWCGGTARITFDVSAVPGEPSILATGIMGGGSCVDGAGSFVVNAGLQVAPTWGGAPPNYAEIVLPSQRGRFSGPGVRATLVIGSITVLVSDISGTRTASGGSFTGVGNGAPVTVSFTC